MATHTGSSPVIGGDTLQPPTGQATGPTQSQDASARSSRSSYTKDLKKPGVTSTALSGGPSRLNHPQTWSRRTRICALAGLVLVVLALVPAIAVPLVERAHHSSPGSSETATPTYVSPPSPSLIANGTALRMMPLGASITYGHLSTDGNGYREDLQGLLRRGGNDNVTYVGSQHNGTMSDNAVEGWPGYRIDQVMPKAAASVPRYLPNVVLLNVGTNDCVQNWNVDNTTVKSAEEPALTANATINVGDRLQALVEAVLAWSPGATVVLSTLIVNQVASTNARVGDANTQFRAVASSLRAAGRRVVLADMDPSAGGPNMTTMADVTHPNDVGYALMANRWYVALQQAGEEGLLVAPSEVQA